MTVESAADLAAMFDEDDFGLSATYTPAGGVDVEVTVIRAIATDDAGLGELGLLSTVPRALLRVAELAAAPAPGDVLKIGATTYRVRAARRDELGAVWALELTEAAS